MQSRTRRYRARQKLAEAAAPTPDSSRGWGKDAPLRRSDWFLLRRALREGWPIPRHVELAIVAGIERILDDAHAAPQWRLAAARTVLAMVALDWRDSEGRLYAAVSALEREPGDTRPWFVVPDNGRGPARHPESHA